MEDPRPGVILILIVLSLILRFNGAILIWTKRDRIPVIPAVILDIFSPVLCIATVSYATGRSFSKDKGAPLKGTIVMILALLISQFITGMIFVGAYFILGLPVPAGRAIGPGGDGSSFQPVHVLFLISFYSLLLFLMLQIIRNDLSLFSFFKGKKILSSTLLGIVALIPLVAAANLFVYAADRLGYGGAPTLVSDVEGSADILYVGVAIVVVAPFIEELLFRGYIYKQIRDNYPAWIAIMATAALFSFAHFSFITFVPIFMLGVFMGIVRERTGSVLPSMTFHAGNNLIALLAIIFSV
jgi:membrane protease YdiL (CAAX protease family)